VDAAVDERELVVEELGEFGIVGGHEEATSGCDDTVAQSESGFAGVAPVECAGGLVG
jgi:hypothetical protein